MGNWLNNYWWLFGLVIIFDSCIKQLVHWAFWKIKNPPEGKQTKFVEWVDANIFAVIAATFIKLFFIEAYTIPTSSMEKSMMVGDYLLCQQDSVRTQNTEYAGFVPVCSSYHALV